MNERIHLSGAMSLVLALAVGSNSALCCEAHAKAVLRLLEDLPSWPTVSFVSDRNENADESRQEDAEVIEAIAAKINEYQLDEIRQGLSLYRQSDKYRPEMAFVIIQFVFDIPEADDRLAKHIIPAFKVLRPRASKPLPASWPWKKARDGTLRFEVRAIGLVRNGPPYPVLRVFDVYRERFGRRRR